MDQQRPTLFDHSAAPAPAGQSLRPPLPGQQFRDSAGRWVGWASPITNPPGDVSAWHYHPHSETYGYVIRGSITIAFGPGGADSIAATAGDFFHIPAQLVHREITSPDAEFEAFVIRVGELPEQVEVDGPPD